MRLHSMLLSPDLHGGRDAEATVFACAALGGISLPRLLS